MSAVAGTYTYTAAEGGSWTVALWRGHVPKRPAVSAVHTVDVGRFAPEFIEGATCGGA